MLWTHKEHVIYRVGLNTQLGDRQLRRNESGERGGRGGAGRREAERMRGSGPVREDSTPKATGWKPPQATGTGRKLNLPERGTGTEPWASSFSDHMLCAKSFPGGISMILVVCYSVKLSLWVKSIHVKLNPWDRATIIQIKASFNIQLTSSCHLLLSILLFWKVKNTCCEPFGYIVRDFVWDYEKNDSEL